MKQQLINSIELRDIKLKEAYECSEMLIIGGEKIISVLEFNGNKLGN